MSKYCESCDTECSGKNSKGKNNYIGNECIRCYRRKMQQNWRDKLRGPVSDNFGNLPSERDYYEDIGYDCQRNQDILLRGLASS